MKRYRDGRRRSTGPRGHPPQAIGALAVSLAAMTGPALAVAGSWEIQPRIRVAEIWTDNVGLTAEDTEHEWITEVTPGVRVSGEGRRARLDLQYQVESLFHGRDNDRDRTNHEFAADGQVELVRRSLFLEADASRSRDIISSDGTGPGSSVFAAGQTDREAWGVGPRWRHDFGRAAGMEASYRRERVEFGTGAFGATDTDLVTAALVNGPVFTRWGWGVDYSRREEARDRRDTVDADVTDEEIILEQVRGELSLRTGPASELFVVGGYEDNEFVTEVEGERIDGGLWEAGGRWNPRRNLALEAAVGERFFGETARASLRARGAALSIDLSYAEDLVTTSQVELQRAEQLVRDADGNLVLGPEGEPVTIAIGVPTVVDDVFEERRARGRLGWSRGSSDVRLSLLATEREFFGEGSTEDAHRVDLDWYWTRLARTTLVAGIGYSEQEFGDTDRVDDTRSLRLGARRELTTRVDGRLDYEGFIRDSTTDGAEYTVNRITLAVEARF